MRKSGGVNIEREMDELLDPDHDVSSVESFHLFSNLYLYSFFFCLLLFSQHYVILNYCLFLLLLFFVNSRKSGDHFFEAIRRPKNRMKNDGGGFSTTWQPKTSSYIHT